MAQFSNAEEYIEKRVKQYQGWYDAKAVSKKKSFLQFRVVSVLGGALIPVLTNVSAIPVPYKDWIVTFIGLVVVVLVSLDTVFHWGEQWRNYRSTEQVLGRELVFFYAQRGAYADSATDEERFGLLVDRCEEAISTENTATLNVLAIQQAKTDGAQDA
ncbi:MAG: DUF4231 domain-containing protein [Pseudomonadota bacterium]